MNVSTRLCIIHLEDETKTPMCDYVVCINIEWEEYEYYVPFNDFRYYNGNVRVYTSLEEYLDEVLANDRYEILNIEYE